MLYAMARRLRIEYEGAVHHVYARGVERRRIFMDDQDRERFLSGLGRGVSSHGVRLYLYCLMPNHVHLLVETPHANLHRFMHQVETAYAVYFNLRHHRSGHLMQGRYGEQPVQGDEYLLKLSRYIHLNPVFVRALREAPLIQRVEALRAYRWSSYQEYLGVASPIGFLEREPLLRLVATEASELERGYGQYVEAGLARDDDEFAALLHAPAWGVGDQDFRARMRADYERRTAKVKCPEDVALRRMSPRKSVEEVLRAVAAELGFEMDPGIRTRG